MTYVPRDPDGRPKRWSYYAVGCIFVAAIVAMTLALLTHH
jgi:bacteriorhodopsin